jgi:hypothetical protein
MAHVGLRRASLKHRWVRLVAGSLEGRLVGFDYDSFQGLTTAVGVQQQLDEDGGALVAPCFAWGC